MNLTEHTNPQQPPTGMASDEEQPMTMPLGVGGENDEAAGGSLDPLAGAQGSKRFNTGAILIVLVMIVAGGGLFAMRTIARASAHMQSNSEVESTIDSFLNMISGGGNDGAVSDASVLLDDDHSTITVLSEEYTDQQVPLSDVQRNPFVIFERSSAASEAIPSGPDPGTEREQMIAKRKRAIEAAAEQLELKSVLMGASPLASIDNKIVRSGETIHVASENVTFRVETITGNAVTLVADDPTLDLTVKHRLMIRRD